MDDEVDSRKWDAWDKVLAGLVSQISGSGRRGDETLQRLYELAVELRDRLRHSHSRLRSLKQELSVTSASARAERHEALARLRELETEVARLASAVQAQGSTLAAREAVAQSQAVENEQLRRQVAALQQQLQRREEDRSVVVTERNNALRHLDKMTQLLEESEQRVVAAESEHSGLLSELVATKGRLADLSALETLYGSARDELDRLDKENLELKDMVATGTVTLGRSRILDALGIPDTTDVFVSTRGRTRRRSSGTGGAAGGGANSARRSHSAPRVGGSGARRALGTGGSSLLGTTLYNRGTFVPDLVPAGTADTYRRAANARSSSPSRNARAAAAAAAAAMAAAASQPPGLEDAVTDMAFLGPPSSAYPPDPENYVFYRVGGGYSPRLDPAQPTIPQPRASGWVPKDVVRLMQAFRHSYGLTLEWRFFEPLLLMIDEVYRSRSSSSLGAMRAAQRDKLRTVKRQLRNALGYPNAVASGKITHLQRQLATARKSLALGDRKGDVALKQMAVKDYHLGAQLDRAVEENYALRRSLQELEQLYSSTVAPASPGVAPIGAAAAAAAPGVSHGPAPGQEQSPPAASYGGLRTPSQYTSPSGAGTAPAAYGGTSGLQYNPYNPYGPYSAGVAAGTPQSAGGNRSTYTSQYSPSQVPYDDDYSRRASAVSAAMEGGVPGSHMVSLGGPPPPEYGSPQASAR